MHSGILGVRERFSFSRGLMTRGLDMESYVRHCLASAWLCVFPLAYRLFAYFFVLFAHGFIHESASLRGCPLRRQNNITNQASITLLTAGSVDHSARWILRRFSVFFCKQLKQHICSCNKFDTSI